VYDVAWSPKNPAVFAHVNGAGCLDIWNLNSDIEEPIVHEVIDEGKEGLNRLKWSLDGKELAIGTASGRVLIYRVSDALAKPENMAKEVEALKARLAEMEEALSEAAAAVGAPVAAAAAVPTV
jgi:WD40 repeat protein